MSFATLTQSSIPTRTVATWTITELWSSKTTVVNEYNNDHEATLMLRLYHACDALMEATHQEGLHETDIVHLVRRWTGDSFELGCATYVRTEVTE